MKRCDTVRIKYKYFNSIYIWNISGKETCEVEGFKSDEISKLMIWPDFDNNKSLARRINLWLKPGFPVDAHIFYITQPYHVKVLSTH